MTRKSKPKPKPKKPKPKKRAAKRRYNSQGIDQYGATRKGPQEDAL